jgi:PDZ domain-containing protein
MTNVDNVPSVPPDPQPTAPARRLLWGALGSVAAVVVAVLIAASLITVPYVIIAPGQTYVATDLVSVPGGVSAYPPGGEVRFVTVSERVDPSVIEKFQADHDGDDQVLTKKEVFGNQSPQQNDTLNAQAMTSSKDIASYVALKQLGYPVTSDGTFVTDVIDGGPAKTAGIQPGELIVAIDGQPTLTAADLRAVLSAHSPGDVVALEVVKDKKEHRTVQVTLAANPDPSPDRNGKAYIGIGVSDDPVLPFQVNIDTTRVGGPSAGLAFTLAIIDVLTPGELTGGQAVAATGEIRPDGSVGAIGGIEQKVVTVRSAGVKVFLVPADDHCGEPAGSCNYTDAKRKAGSSLQVISVANLDEALNALASVGGNALAIGQPGKPPSS